jgi:hypothetical protein
MSATGPRGLSFTGSVALPVGSATVNGPFIDLGMYTEFLGDNETITVTAPSLTTGQLANGATMIYSVQADRGQKFENPTTISAALIVQTGAGGAGSAGANATLTLPRGFYRFLRVVAVNSGSQDCSASSMSWDVEL